MFCFFFFFKQKTAYEMRISDWSSDVCSSDLSSRAARRAGRQLSICRGLFAHDVLRLVALRRRRGRCHEGGKRTAFAAHDNRGKAVEPRCTARFDADRLREIDIAAIAREGAIIPVALAVLDPEDRKSTRLN